MNAEELFEVAVKVIGLLSLGRGVGDLVSVISIALSQTTTSVTSNDYFTTLKWGIIYTCMGFFLIRATSFVVNFAFPYSEPEIEKDIAQESTNETENSN